MQNKKNLVRKVRIIAMCVFGIMTLAVHAQGADAEYPIISTDQLKAIVDTKTEVMLIDTRTPTEYREGHIAGAINIPDKNIDKSLGLLPKDKNTLLVFYCNGTKCGKSTKMADRAAAAGHKNMQIYDDGFPVWEEKGLNIVTSPDYAKKVETTMIMPVVLKKLIDSKSQDYVLVDVREESEYKAGHIPGAINIPVDVFASHSYVLPIEKKIIVYCNTGDSSYAAYRKLMKLAFPFIAQANFTDWKEAKMPVVK